MKFGIVFFQGKRRIPQLKRSPIHPDSPLFSQRPGVNMASLCDFSFLQLFFHGFLCKAGQKPSQPAVYPLCSYPSKAVALLTTRLSLLQPERRDSPWCHLTAGHCQELFPAQSYFFYFLKANLTAVFLFLSLVLLFCTDLGLVKFIILHCGAIFSGKRWEQSHLNPCKSCGEQTCCPKAPSQGRAVDFLYLLYWDTGLCCLP